MKVNKEIQDFLLREAQERFLRYVKIHTTSDEKSTTFPSTENQFELGKLLSIELKELGISEVIHDKYGYVYAKIPPNPGCENVKPIGFIAHLDTSPAVKGENVEPIIHENYDGTPIQFPKDDNLTLTKEDSPLLESCIGLDIITASGDTLLGADDKAGIAEIMAVCAAWKKFPELKHGSITICFTPDEEIGKGTMKIDKSKLPDVCYTIDGSEMGELEIECFDAWLAEIEFHGLSVHPGYSKNNMINAIHIASRYFSELPEAEAPEHTEEREGFFHLSKLFGNEEHASARLIIRDYEEKNNERRMNYLTKLKELYEIRHPGLKINVKFTHQYKNMLRFLEKDKKVIDLAREAIKLAGLEIKEKAIRGGTDGSKLSEMGIPTPNIFTGGLLFHSRKEFIPTIALQKAAEVIIYLADLWTRNNN